jgi:hypothetical protein
MLRRLDVPRDSAPWERIVLRAAFRKEESPGLTRVEHAFAGIRAAVQPFDAAVRAHLQRTREIASQREKQGRPLFLVAGTAAAVAFPSFALVPLQWSGLGPAAFAVPAALALVVLAALIAGATLPRTGMREHPRVAAWRGFAQHLKLTAKDPAGLDTAHFHAWLPYAVAFDLQPAWLQAAKRLHLQPPAWFHGKPDDPADVAALAALFGRLTETSPPTHTAA